MKMALPSAFWRLACVRTHAYHCLALSLLLALGACRPDPGVATQIIVAVDADEETAPRLTRIVIQTYDPEHRDEDGKPKQAGRVSFELSPRKAAGTAELPFSFAVEKQKGASFLLVVTGYKGNELVIESKAQLAFKDGERRAIGIFLASPCYRQLCGGEDDEDWLSRTCSATSAEDFACEDVPMPPTVAITGAGTEFGALDGGPQGLDGGPRDGGSDADPDDDMGAEDGGPDDAEAGPSDGSTPIMPPIEAGPESGLPESGMPDAGHDAGDGGADTGPATNPCQPNPCGAGHTCNVVASDFICNCADTHFQLTPKSCGGPKFLGVGAGLDHTCAWRTDGALVCWGDTEAGKLGHAGSAPALAVGISNVIGMAGGDNHTCARRGDYSVMCWGQNTDGQLGTGNNADTGTPTLVSGLTMVSSIAAGFAYTCALRMDQSVACWGYNGNRELGNTTATVSINAPATVTGVSPATRLAAGGFNGCVLRSDGVYCWGGNASGQLCNATGTASGPTLSALSMRAEIAVGEEFVCALRSDNGGVGCCGKNGSGQLGNGMNVNASSPVPVGTLTGATKLAAGGSHACAIVGSSGTVSCWGLNNHGQLGNGSTANANTPVVVAGLTNVSMLAAGANHTCAFRGDGNVWCWGDNSAGQLGSGTGDSSVPVRVTPP